MLDGSENMMSQTAFAASFVPISQQQPPAMGQQDPKSQICFDFTKGVCMRGDACKYSHNLARIVEVNSQERGVCFDYLRGQCSRGLLCRFSHDLAGIAAQQDNSSAAAAKRNAPICYDFVKGQCTREDCRYSHNIASVINGTKGRNTSPTEMCFDFARGKCLRGTACRYLHVLPPKAGWPPGCVPPGVLAALPNGALPGMQYPGIPQMAAGSSFGCMPHALPALTAAGLAPHANQLGSNASGGYAFGQYAQQMPHAFDPASQNYELLSQMAALQAAHAVNHSMVQQQMQAAQQSMSQRSSQEDLADSIRKLHLQAAMQQTGEQPAGKQPGKQPLRSAGPSGSFSDDVACAKIGAVWEQQAASLAPLVTGPQGRSLPPSGATTPRTPALEQHQPFSVSHSWLSRSCSFPAQAAPQPAAAEPSSFGSSRSGSGAFTAPSTEASLPVTARAADATGIASAFAHQAAPASSQPATARTDNVCRFASAFAADSRQQAGSYAVSAPVSAVPSRTASPAPPQGGNNQGTVQSWIADLAYFPPRTAPVAPEDSMSLSRLQSIWQPQPQAAAV